MWRKLLGKLKKAPGIKKHLKQARKGSVKAMFAVGKAYLRGGKEVAPHAGHAVWWMERAARAGHQQACVHASRLAWDGFVSDEMGLGQPLREASRVEDAFMFARLGHQRGDPEASLFLVWLLDATKMKADTERLEALRAAAEKGLPLALVGLADLEARSGASAERVMDLLSIPLEKNLGIAHHMVSTWHGQGDLLPLDEKKARHHLEIAASAGYVPAMALLGECLMVENHRQSDDEGRDENKERLRRLTRGESLLRKAAASNGRAACVLGDYWSSIAESPDLQQAIQWYEKAVSLGFVGAFFMSGRLVLEGRSTYMTQQDAWIRIKQAAEAGHVGAKDILSKRSLC
ncbi:MAG: sel1 repeat family protein [Acetobacter sp.]|uniref:tetratricopeptide repeat protein n=1 Tax=Acetobacter sp. TaxID=440 RepID=UPI0039ED5B46